MNWPREQKVWQFFLCKAGLFHIRLTFVSFAVKKANKTNKKDRVPVYGSVTISNYHNYLKTKLLYLKKNETNYNNFAHLS